MIVLLLEALFLLLFFVQINSTVFTKNVYQPTILAFVYYTCKCETINLNLLEMSKADSINLSLAN